MHILLVYLKVKPEHLDAFRAATLENARSSRQEPGVVRFDVIQEIDDPGRFCFIEVYHTPEGLAAHRESPHYLAWVAKIPDMLVEPRTRAVYRNVDPPDQEW